MEVLNYVLWITVTLLLIAAIVLAVFASRSGKDWLAVPCVGFVAVWILWALVDGMRTAPSFGFIVSSAIGLLALAVIAGSPIVSLVLRLATRGSEHLGDHGGILVGPKDDEDEDDQPREREILRGGMTIGFLERFAIVGSAFAGQFAAVAVVVAIKGLGRFSELENAEARERFIIGTLASFIWAGVCAVPIVLAF
ncbi:hypothetical protein [Cryobacterium sp. BB736]|uniref:hypothetical protein n=1 Tax=Cryobacterium sp. BB736 TaxID=2746963 RepID=UPI001D0BE9B1|nr:hypothetical protein [Cryobacterium sp. BB736]